MAACLEALCQLSEERVIDLNGTNPCLWKPIHFCSIIHKHYVKKTFWQHRYRPEVRFWYNAILQKKFQSLKSRRTAILGQNRSQVYNSWEIRVNSYLTCAKKLLGVFLWFAHVPKCQLRSFHMAEKEALNFLKSVLINRLRVITKSLEIF